MRFATLMIVSGICHLAPLLTVRDQTAAELPLASGEFSVELAPSPSVVPSKSAQVLPESAAALMPSELPNPNTFEPPLQRFTPVDSEFPVPRPSESPSVTSDIAEPALAKREEPIDETKPLDRSSEFIPAVAPAAPLLRGSDSKARIVDFHPTYPFEANQNHIEGVVTISLRITKDGRATEVKVRKSSGHALLDEAAIRDVQRATFEPERINGMPVAKWVELRLRYRFPD